MSEKESDDVDDRSSLNELDMDASYVPDLLSTVCDASDESVGEMLLLRSRLALRVLEVVGDHDTEVSLLSVSLADKLAEWLRDGFD